MDDHESAADGEPVTPPLADALRVIIALREHGLEPAVGGSGLLLGLGLVHVAHDWDITVDAPVAHVLDALTIGGLAYRDETLTGGVYASDRRLVLDGPVDLLVNFALHGPNGVEPMPSRVTAHWRGLPLADPTVWARAYRIMGRIDKAILLDGHR
ncbi:hypothetical protein [Microlunatus soli]|uniref:Nucleotidyl transferase AbiEii toxin, Type IV TA system n=1 Tax=Microlunatus soli TaxID=630515 RepID=A0A1H1SCY9_9ACTN|nr:hypothetical protein [Microlunatus soli]SDS45855.1 hypothetical protein SAMN04489812_1968 [Microlunatus soli]